MADFSFRCPHCGQTTRVGLESLGQAALCSACARPYLAEVPRGTLLNEDGEPAGRAAREQPAPGRALPAARLEEKEQTVMTVNPAAFRRSPVQTLMLFALIIAGMIGLIMFAGKADQVGFAILTAVCALAAGVALLVLAYQFALTRIESLIITSQRTIWARGLINRRSSEIQHDDIRNIKVEQNMIERLVSAGTVSISSAGTDEMEIIAQGIANPHRVINLIRTHQRRMVRDD